MKRVTALLLFATTLPLVLFSRVEAMSITGLSVTLDCSGFSYGDFNFTLDRDNTGAGTESYQIVVTDSASNLIHLESITNALGGYSQSAGGAPYNLGTPVPGAITYAWKSLAGNSLEEQTAYEVVGFCSAPTATPTPTPEPTATPVPAPTATANYVLRSTLVFGDQSYDVAIKLEVTPADYVMVGFLVVITGLLMMLIFIVVRREQR